MTWRPLTLDGAISERARPMRPPPTIVNACFWDACNAELEVDDIAAARRAALPVAVKIRLAWVEESIDARVSQPGSSRRPYYDRPQCRTE